MNIHYESKCIASQLVPESMKKNQYCCRLLPVILNMASRFAALGDDDLDNLLDMRDSKNTKRIIKASLEVFKAYVVEKEMNFDQCMSFSSEEMNCLLRNIT